MYSTRPQFVTIKVVILLPLFKGCSILTILKAEGSNVGLENVLMAYSLCKVHIQCAYTNRYPIMRCL